MISVLTKLDTGWLDTKVERQMWLQTCKSYNVKDFRAVVGDHNFEKALQDVEGVKVFLEPTGDIELSKLKHPEDAVYIFSDSKASNLRYMQDGDLAVRIETNGHHLFGVVAFAIVMYDRWLKWQRRLP